jgi:NAD(P)-dependent dehydrogenase (short-subunit alcohol dehydrogenase family)
VNHLGHFLFTSLLLERLRASAPARVVTVASRSHTMAKAIDWEALGRPTRSLTGVPEYAVSKLCNVLFSAELSRRLVGAGVSTYAVHPGTIASDIWGRRLPWPLPGIVGLFLASTEEGAKTSLHCATAAGAEGQTGLYWDACRPRTPSRLARDEALARELWRRSEEMVG